MSTDHLPSPTGLASPHTSVPIQPAHHLSRDFNREASAECRDGNVCPNSPDAKLLRLMHAEADDARCVRLQVLRLGPKLPVWSGEQKIFANQLRQGVYVRGELCGSDSCLEGDNFRIRLTDQDGVHGGNIGVRHGHSVRTTRAIRCSRRNLLDNSTSAIEKLDAGSPERVHHQTQARSPKRIG